MWYGERRRAATPVRRWYSDGSFHGPFPLMASSMELEKDRPFDALVKSVIPTIKAEFESVIRHLRPPPYPYEIDRTLAARGKELFYSQEVGCARCHGVYDGRGNVDWPGVHKDVGGPLAPRRRLASSRRSRTPAGPRRALSRARIRGDAADRCRRTTAAGVPMPYLLGPVSERPAIFHVMAAGRSRQGRQLLCSIRGGRLDERCALHGGTATIGTGSTWRGGASSRGHNVQPRTVDNRRAVISISRPCDRSHETIIVGRDPRARHRAAARPSVEHCVLEQKPLAQRGPSHDNWCSIPAGICQHCRAGVSIWHASFRFYGALSVRRDGIDVRESSAGPSMDVRLRTGTTLEGSTLVARVASGQSIRARIPGAINPRTRHCSIDTAAGQDERTFVSWEGSCGRNRSRLRGLARR